MCSVFGQFQHFILGALIFLIIKSWFGVIVGTGKGISFIIFLHFSVAMEHHVSIDTICSARICAPQPLLCSDQNEPTVMLHQGCLGDSHGI